MDAKVEIQIRFISKLHVVQHLNLPALGIVIVVEVDVDGEGNRLYVTFLPVLLDHSGKFPFKGN